MKHKLDQASGDGIINRTKDTFGVKGFVPQGDTVVKLSFSKGKITPTKNGGGRSKTYKY